MLLERYFSSIARPSVAVIVAHPDDEVLWAGGQILARPDWDWTLVTLCRGADPDRAPRFRRVLERLGARGAMGDLDDGPDQTPLPPAEVRTAILTLLSRTAVQGGPSRAFDGVLTHGPRGEYTRHRRHEEVSRAVADLWRSGELAAGRLFLFAYEDGGRAYLPRPRADAHLVETLAETLWRSKRDIITGLYGFGADSWESRAVPREEALWHFDSPTELARFVEIEGTPR